MNKLSRYKYMIASSRNYLKSWFSSDKKASSPLTEQLIDEEEDLESGNQGGVENQVLATKDQLKELHNVDIRCRKVGGTYYGTPIMSQTSDFYANYIKLVFFGSMIEGIIIGDVCINSPSAANFLNNDLPSQFYNTGATFAINVLVPTIFATVIVLGKKCFYSDKKKQPTPNSHAVATNINKFREFFFLYLSTQVPKFIGSMEQDFNHTSKATNFFAQYPGSTQFFQFGIGALIGYLTSVKTPEVMPDDTVIKLKIKNKMP